MGEADAKFPGQYRPAIPPSPTRENPGQVYPKSDPKAAAAESVPGTGGEHNQRMSNALGNPYAYIDTLRRLESSLTDAISSLEQEETSVGSSEEQETLLAKFKDWRQQILALNSGHKAAEGAQEGSPAKGGMFAD